MIERLKILQANKRQFTNGGELSKACKTDSVLRHEIEILAKHYLSKTVSGCSNCYTDAYFELINLKLENAMSKDTCLFKLKAGALLRDVAGNDHAKMCTNANLSNDLALYHLRTNPSCRKYFTALPENVDEMIYPKLEVVEPELSEEEKAAQERELEAQKAAQENAEKELVIKVAELLKAGTTKTAIRETYEKQNVGTKKITQRMMTDFLKLADALVQKVEDVTPPPANNPE